MHHMHLRDPSVRRVAVPHRPHIQITDPKFAEFPWVVGEPIQVLCVARVCTRRKKMRAIAGYSVFRFAQFVFLADADGQLL